MDEQSLPSAGTAITNIGAVLAVLLGVPSLFIGMFGFVGFITGQKLIAGALGSLWGYMAVVGAYELNRRKFNLDKGRQHADMHLLAGTVAVSAGLVISGAMHETMPALALVPAISAIRQADNGHDNRHRSMIHTGILLVGLGVGIWFFTEGVIGK
ncbi:MAG: hypothetical protein MI865_00700, partial [Proteobacteria bacterium]|nr:hypothetical protein [Pseudomonadota bacterium]